MRTLKKRSNQPPGLTSDDWTKEFTNTAHILLLFNSIAQLFAISFSLNQYRFTWLKYCETAGLILKPDVSLKKHH